MRLTYTPQGFWCSSLVSFVAAERRGSQITAISNLFPTTPLSRIDLRLTYTPQGLYLRKERGKNV